MPFGPVNISKPNFKKISDFVWEVPQDFKKGMRVPARVFASRKLLDEMDLQVYDQLTNVATLPGIVGHALCMPDGHSGYGFPIGGVAAFDAKEGVISPGGVGFDINCLAGSTKILLGHGYTRTIASLEEEFERCGVTCFTEQGVRETRLAAFQKKKEQTILRITTKSGREILASKDHPILTKAGMVEAGKLKEGGNACIYGFDGTPFEQPSGETVISEKQIEAIGAANKRTRSAAFKLKQKSLLPLAFDNPALPYLAKLVGFVTGDGNITFLKDGKATVTFYGKEEDLLQVRDDILALGFPCGKIFKRARHHAIKTSYGLVEFDFEEASLKSGSQALATMLCALGAVAGNKTRQPMAVPQWLGKAPLWIRRLYLAALFGAELSSPKTVTGHGRNFYGPMLSLNKQKELRENGEAFLGSVKQMLSQFGVESRIIGEREEFTNKQGIVSVRQRLQLSSTPQNLKTLWSTIGFEYNREKQFLAIAAAHYLKLKQAVVNRRAQGARLAIELHNQGRTLKQVASELSSLGINERFIARSIWEKRKTPPRATSAMPCFKEFLQAATAGLPKSGQTWDEIEGITEVPWNDFVYDFTTLNEAHNFAANGIVTHNCGMRLVTTNLTIDQVRPKLKELVDLLFKRVPAGVGSEGFVKLTPQEFRKVIMQGGDWCVEKGYGWEEDLRRTEEEGNVKGADETKVSDMAVKRGKNQIGTLGSGNHYLEVQYVKPENIFDEKAAKAYGIFPNQVVVMFHCGSRGFGHQVATDYLQKFLSVMEPKYGIKILDRELSCAPFASQEGQDYFAAMKCALNMSFANRQVILHQIRQCFEEVFKKKADALEMRQVYDVAHNTAKEEEYVVDGTKKKLLVHRKGATRSFGPHSHGIPPEFASIGQPVIIGGSMETGSYLLAGTETAMKETWGSTAHGSGRTMSRTKAKQLFRGDQLQKDMEAKGILVRTVSYAGLAEEAGAAYKDIDEVIDAAHNAGISRKVVKLLPIANVKG